MLTAQQSIDKITSSPEFKASARAHAISMLASGYPVGDNLLFRRLAANMRAGRYDADPEYKEAVLAWIGHYNLASARLAEFNARRRTG